MEAISAREAIMAMTKSQVMIVIQITPAVPPLNRPKYDDLAKNQYCSCKTCFQRTDSRALSHVD